MTPSRSIPGFRRSLPFLLLMLLLGPGFAVPGSEELVLQGGASIRGYLLKQSDDHYVMLTDRGIEAITVDSVTEVIRPEAEVARAPAGKDPEGGGEEEGEDLAVPGIPQPEGGRLQRRSGSGGEKVGLVISGSLDGEQIDSSHEQTRAFIGYYLVQGSPKPLTLVANDPDEVAAADVKLVVNSVTEEKAGVKFMGASVFSRFTSRVTIEFHEKVGGEFRLTEKFSVNETTTGHEDRRKSLIREAYDGAFNAAVRKLRSLPYFNDTPEAEKK